MWKVRQGKEARKVYKHDEANVKGKELEETSAKIKDAAFALGNTGQRCTVVLKMSWTSRNYTVRTCRMAKWESVFFCGELNMHPDQKQEFHSFWFSKLQTQNTRTRCWSTSLSFKCLWSGAKKFQSGRINFEVWLSKLWILIGRQNMFLSRVWTAKLQATVSERKKDRRRFPCSIERRVGKFSEKILLWSQKKEWRALHQSFTCRDTLWPSAVPQLTQFWYHQRLRVFWSQQNLSNGNFRA